MSNFWENNKEAIYKNTTKAAKTTGKYAWAGTKTLSKAGYNAAKGNPQSVSSDKADEPLDFGETRNLNSLPDVAKFPPPPLKPGQKQYTSEKLKAQFPQAAVPQSAVPQAADQPDQSQYQQPEGQYQQFQAQPQQTQYQQAPPQSAQQILQQAPVHVSDQAQQAKSVPGVPPRETIAVPPTQVTVGTTTLNIPAYSVDKQQALNISGQLVSGVFKAQQSQNGQLSGTYVQGGQSLPGLATLPQQQETPSAQDTVPLQQPALDYSNPYYQGAVSVPQYPQIAAPMENSPGSLQPVDNGRAPPPPPPTRDYLRPQVAVPQQLPSRETSTPSPDLSGFAIPPKRTIPTVPCSTEQPGPQIPPTASILPEPVSRFSSSQSVNRPAPPSRIGSVASDSVSRKVSVSNGQEEEPASKGIAGTYDYKIDVKFAPPPVHRDSVPSPHNKTFKPSTSGIKSPSLASVPRASAGAQRAIPTPSSRSSISSESITGTGPPPPPSRTLSSNFPPPPRPTNPTTHQANEIHHPQPPLRTHISSSSIPGTPPPAYSPMNVPVVERDTEVLDESVPVQPQAPQLNVSNFAPPPKPFRKQQEPDLSELEVKESSPELVIPTTKPEVLVDKSDVTSKPLIPTKPAFNMNAFPPPPRAPAKSKYVQNTTEELFEVIKLKHVKPTPLVPAHKPQVDIKKKIPPPVKPKPDLSKKVPPVINPKPSALKKTPPPLKPKPQVVEDGSDDNPFSKYLKTAVPEEDDRFHRR
jgi:hypothetical protein